MTDRDRLIELLQNKSKEPICIEGLYEWADDIADYLLANGVTVLPLPIGSTVYEIRARGNRPTLYGSRKVDFSIMNRLYFESAIAQKLELYVKEKSFVKYDKTRWNKTVFLTKEEAEGELEKRYNNG